MKEGLKHQKEVSECLFTNEMRAKNPLLNDFAKVRAELGHFSGLFAQSEHWSSIGSDRDDSVFEQKLVTDHVERALQREECVEIVHLPIIHIDRLFDQISFQGQQMLVVKQSNGHARLVLLVRLEVKLHRNGESYSSLV
jgi:hypothetical protein